MKINIDMANNQAQKRKPPSAMPIIAPLDTLVCAGGEEGLGVIVALVAAVLVLIVADKVVDVAVVAVDRKSAASIGSFDSKAGAKSVGGHCPASQGLLVQHPRNGGLVFSQV